ncbi:MAG: cation diffusion facilitator family transporter [Gammaproteobacteria bacterium]|nr:cation diffusion facilitator family transporter [Gammaproteobacteria bacterium]MCW8986552.1 cation diffusion facilitator family transporter [Gammaproteobacteria bacterium]MCW9030341.1 cation diffusion facilitator family transporter [Gammaproteobacteria bacterium]
MSHDHGHHHPDPSQPVDDDGNLLLTSSTRYKDTVRVTIIGSIVDFLLGVAKITIGFIAQSQALIADGVHSLSDLATDFAVLYAAKHSHQEADEEHPYGHGRIETVVTVGLGIALMGVAIGIMIDATNRLFNPTTLFVPGVLALSIAIISVIAKEAIYQYTMVIARRYRSNMLKANAWHSRSDAISSIIVVVGIIGSMAGLTYLDSIAAIGVGIMIAKIGWDLAWHSIKELIDTGLDAERVKEIEKNILGVEGVTTLHVLRTRQIGADALVDVHIQVDPYISVSEAHYISETVRSKLIKKIEEVIDVMVHIDPEDDEDAGPIEKLPLRAEILKKMELAWAGIEEAKKIDSITLHYLEGKIQIELLLPLAILHNAQPDADTAVKQRFKDALKNVKEIDRVSVHYH